MSIDLWSHGTVLPKKKTELIWSFLWFQLQSTHTEKMKSCILTCVFIMSYISLQGIHMIKERGVAQWSKCSLECSGSIDHVHFSSNSKRCSLIINFKHVWLDVTW